MRKYIKRGGHAGRSGSIIAAGLAAVFITALSAERPAAAIDIILQNTQDFDGEEDPDWDEGAATLMAHAEAAAAIWEQFFPSSTNTYELWIEWDNDIGGSLGKWTPTGDPTWNLIEINSDRTWFRDSTPFDHIEFDFATPAILSPTTQGTTLYRDLNSQRQADWFPRTAPPAVLEVGFRGFSPTIREQSAFDLLGTLIHEMGHELGISWIEPGEYNIYPHHIGNLTDLLVAEDPDPFSGHLAGDGDAAWLMCEDCGITGVRRLPSATDILVIAEDQGINDVRLARTDYIGGGWHNPVAWIGGRVPDPAMVAFVRNGPGSCSVDLSAGDGLALAIQLSVGCSLYTYNHTLATFGGTSVVTSRSGEPASEIVVMNNGHVSLHNLALQGGQLNFSAGGTAGLHGTTTIDVNDGVVGRIYGNAAVIATAYVETALVNNGLIRANSGTLAFQPLVSTLPTLDLDGSPGQMGIEPGELDALHGDLSFNGILADDFDGQAKVGAAQRITFSENWTLGHNGRLLLSGGSGTPAKVDGSSTSTIKGRVEVSRLGRLATTATVLESTADVVVDGELDRLELTGVTTYRGGSYTGRGTLAQMGLGIVDRSTTIDVDTFDWDGDPAAPSTTSVLPGAVLRVDSPQLNPSASDYHGQFHSLGGTLHVAMRYNNPLVPPPTWTLASDGALHLRNETSNSQTGEPPGLGSIVRGVPLEVLGSIVAQGRANRIDSDVSFRHTARVHLLTPDSELFLNGETRFQAGSYTGPGTLIQTGDATVAPNIAQFPPHTIIDVATYDWDGHLVVSPSSTHVTPGATLFIRSQQIDVPGDGYDGDLRIDAGVVMVRLSGTASSWELDPGGTIRLQNGAVLSGASDVNDPRQTGGSLLRVEGDIIASGLTANEIYSSIVFEPSSHLTVENGATLDIRGERTAYRGGNYTGPGALRQWTRASVDEPTTMSVATLDLDGGNENTFWEVNADLTLNVNQIDTGNNVFHGSLDANANATLAVNLPARATWEVAGSIAVGSVIPSATLQVTGSPVKLSGGVHVKDGGMLVFHSNVTGPASFTGGGSVQFLGEYSPGNSPVIVNFATDLEFGPDATLKMETRGVMPGSHLDQLVVSQDVVFNGTLDIDLLGPYMPRLGDEFVLATYAGRRGTFAATDLPLLSPGTYWAIDYGSTALTLTVSKTLAGDVTLDGMVTDADAALFATYLGLESGSTWATGDFNGDGMTTLADLALLQANLGMSAPSPSAKAVPEPSSIVLAALALVALAMKCRGRKARGGMEKRIATLWRRWSPMQWTLRLIPLLIALGSTGAVPAADRYWVPHLGGAFGTPGGPSLWWSDTPTGVGGSTVPSINDKAHFNKDFDAYTITFGQDVVNASLLVSDGDVTFDLNGNTYELAIAPLCSSIRVVDRLTVTDGTLDVNSSGTCMRVSGDGSTAGWLTISTGGRLGDGATNPSLIVGQTGSGILKVESSGRAFLDELSIGSAAIGSVYVTGSQATLTVAGVTAVGVGHLGSLEISNGATATLGELRIGDIAAVSSVRVNGGSTMTTGPMYVASSGDARVTIQSGGVISSASAYVGTVGGYVDDVGQVDVINAGSTWNIAGDFYLGGTFTAQTNPGILNIGTGATVALSNMSSFYIYPKGILNLNGGTLSVPDFAYHDGTVNFNSGEFEFNGPQTLVNSELEAILGPGQIVYAGRMLSVAGAATLQGSLVVDGGIFSVGSLANQGALALRSGRFDVTGASGLNLSTAGLSTLAVPFGLSVQVTNSLTVAGGNQLIVSGGTVTAGSITNAAGGRITLDGPTAQLAPTGAGPNLSNSGMLMGGGGIGLALSNSASGEIWPTGDGLAFTGATNMNQGELHLNGSRAEFTGPLTNSSTGVIDGRGTLVTGALTNAGLLAFSGGFADVHGDVNHTAGARVVTSGGGVTTFYDDVVHNGAEIRTAEGSRTVIFGALTGGGRFTGTGVVQLEGDLRPGNSPAIVTFDGDLEFGPLAALSMEIGGTTPGAEYDRVTVANGARLDGALDVDLIGGFTPAVNQSFVLLTYGSHVGEFDTLDLPLLPTGMTWSLDYGAAQLTLSTIASLLLGDIDLDGDVDHRDAALFTPHLGVIGNAVWSTGDFDSDNSTTLADLALLQANLGMSAPSPFATHNAVPEPATALLALCMVAMWTKKRGRRQGPMKCTASSQDR